MMKRVRCEVCGAEIEDTLLALVQAKWRVHNLRLHPDRRVNRAVVEWSDG